MAKMSQLHQAAKAALPKLTPKKAGKHPGGNLGKFLHPRKGQ